MKSKQKKGTFSLKKIIGNLIWFFFVGLFSGILWGILGLIWCVSIVGIPFGIQAFKFARLTEFPFGKRVTTNFNKHPVANVIWFISGGFLLAGVYFLAGVILYLTFIGVPFGKQCIKIARLASKPFGAHVI